jgi:hypothetical protein
MNDANIATESLRRIDERWEQLKATKVNTLEYKTIAKEIGVLSMGYQKLVDAPKKPKMSDTQRSESK